VSEPNGTAVVRSAGAGMGTMLFLTLLVLKLTHVINLAWPLVILSWFAPLGLGLIFVGGFLALAFVFAGVATVIDRSSR
jgi:hypothetical protein